MDLTQTILTWIEILITCNCLLCLTSYLVLVQKAISVSEKYVKYNCNALTINSVIISLSSKN